MLLTILLRYRTVPTSQSIAFAVAAISTLRPIRTGILCICKFGFLFFQTPAGGDVSRTQPIDLDKDLNRVCSIKVTISIIIGIANTESIPTKERLSWD